MVGLNGKWRVVSRIVKERVFRMRKVAYDNSVKHMNEKDERIV